MNARHLAIENGPRLALLWAGTVLGCTFIATPVKFQAPSLTLPVALEIGRVTFRAVGAVELLFALATLGLMGIGFRRVRFGAVLPALILAAQWLLVMPMLAPRTEAQIQGETVPGSALHLVFIALEAAKLGALLALGFRRAPIQSA